LLTVFSPLLSAAPVPAPLEVPVPGLPLEDTVPDSPPTIPVSVPFLVTTSPVPGATGGGDDDVGAGVLVGGEAGGLADFGALAGGAGAVVRSLQPPNERAASSAADNGKTARTMLRFKSMVVSSLSERSRAR
jgi:hypothetical protein